MPLSKTTQPELLRLCLTSSTFIFNLSWNVCTPSKKLDDEFLRKSYSGLKKVTLSKLFTICTTDGYVVAMLRPYRANLNNAEILRTF